MNFLLVSTKKKRLNNTKNNYYKKFRQTYTP